MRKLQNLRCFLISIFSIKKIWMNVLLQYELNVNIYNIFYKRQSWAKISQQKKRKNFKNNVIYV